MNPRTTFSSVDDYLAALDPAQAKILRSVHATIRRSVPTAVPVISYGIPAFKQDRVFIFCGGFKRHMGIYPPVRNNAKLQAALRRYANAKGNLSFPFTEPMPMRRIASRLSGLVCRDEGADRPHYYLGAVALRA